MADDPTAPQEPAKPAEPAAPIEDKPLAPEGEKALEAFKQRAREAERAAKKAEAELEKIQKANMSEQEKAIAEAKAEARKEALGEANSRLVRSEVRAAAAGKLADPSDAPALLGDLDRFVNEAGDVDAKALSSAIDELVKAKPYLAPANGKPGRLPGGGAKPSDGVSMDDWIRGQAASKGRM